MKNLKKVLALVVVFAMMMSTLAFAAGFPDVAADADYANAINVLSDLGFFTGDDKGNFNPDATITRAEYAVVVCRILGLNAAGVSEFADVAADHWATGYVNAASQAGIIKGYGNGNFGPSDPVKYEEAVTMLVRALGYEPLAIAKGNWPNGHISVASTYGLLSAVDGTVGEGAKRSAVAVMTYNALDIPVVEQTGFGTDVQYTIMKQTKDQDKSTLLTKLDIFKVGGYVTADAKTFFNPATGTTLLGEVDFYVSDDFDNPDKYLRYSDNNNGKIDVSASGTAADKVKTFRDNAGLAAGYMNKSAVAYVERYATNKYDLVAIEVADAAEALVIDLADVNGGESTLTNAASVSGDFIRYYKEGASKTTKINLKDDYNVVLNNTALALNSAARTNVINAILGETLVGNVEFIDRDNSGRGYDVVNITAYTHFLVDEVDAKNGIISTYGNNMNRINLRADDEEALVTVKDVNGNDVDFATLKEFDVLAAVINPSPILGPVNLAASLSTSLNAWQSLDIVVLGESKVEGLVKGQGTTAAGRDVYTINGEKYEYEASPTSAYVSATNPNGDINYLKNPIQVGAEGTFFLGINGKIVGFEGAKASDGNYAFIIGAFGESTRSTTATLTLLTEDGSIKTFEYADTVKVVNANTNDSIRVKVKNPLNTIVPASVGAPTLATVLTNTAWAGFEGSSDALYMRLFNLYNEENDDLLGLNTTLWSVNTFGLNGRIIQYNVNAAGQIDEIIPAFTAVNSDGYLNKVEFAKTGAEYDKATQRLNRNTIADDVVVFAIDTKELGKSTVRDLSYFADESEYGAILYDANDDMEYQAAVIVEDQSKFEVGTALAIVKAVEVGVNAETGASIATLTVVANGEEKEIVIDNDDFDTIDVTTEFGFGYVMLYNADSTGLVTDFDKVGAASLVYNVGTGKMDMNFAFNGGFNTNIDPTDPYEDEAYFLGYYVNNKKALELNVTNEIIGSSATTWVDANIDVFPGFAKANQYLFTSSGRKQILEVGDALGVLTKHDDVTDTIYNFVLVRTVDGILTDVIGFEYDDNDTNFANN